MKGKYQYNPENLNYSKVDYNIWQKFLRFVLPQILAAGVVAFILFFSLSYFFDTPEERELKNEMKYTSSNLDRLENKYEQAHNVLMDLQKRDENIYRAVFEAEPSSMFQNQLQIDIDKYLKFPAKEKAKLLSINSQRLDTIEYKIKMKTELYNDFYDLIAANESFLSKIPAILPIRDNTDNNPVYGFGQHLDPFYKTSVFHTGLDLAIPVGTPIIATGGGVVTRTLTKRRQYGKHIIISHGNGYESLYANLSEIRVYSGKHVKRGDIIAFSGNTGKSAAPHLHYEVRKDGKAVDPANFVFLNLTPEQFERFTFKASQPGQVLD